MGVKGSPYQGVVNHYVPQNRRYQTIASPHSVEYHYHLRLRYLRAIHIACLIKSNYHDLIIWSVGENVNLLNV